MTQTPPISDEKVEAAKKAFRRKAPKYWLEVRDADAILDKCITAALTAAASIPASRGSEPRETFDEWWERGHSDGQYDQAAKNVACAAWHHARRLWASPAPQPVQEQEPVAWLHRIKEPDMEAMQLFSWSAENPWSHWLSKHMAECSYSVQPLYAKGQPTND